MATIHEPTSVFEPCAAAFPPAVAETTPVAIVNTEARASAATKNALFLVNLSSLLSISDRARIRRRSPCFDTHFCESFADMSQLATTDARELLAFVGEAQAVGGPDPFTTELLDRLAVVMRCEFASYYRLDFLRSLLYDSVACSNEADLAVPAAEGWASDSDRDRGPNPAWRNPSFIGKWSDAWERDVRRRFEAIPRASLFGVVDGLGTSFGPGSSDRSILALHSQDRDFTERDRAKVIALRPHVFALIRDARARQQLASLLATMELEGKDEPHGLLLLSGRLDVEHASPAARRIVESWFGGLRGRLPSPLEDWLTSPERDQPLSVEGNGRRLVVKAPAKNVLVFEETAVPPASLTARELEVLRCLAAGKSTAEVARLLWVTPATVSKHLEHIYRKLGVTSRTAALAAVGFKAETLADAMPGYDANVSR